MICEHKKEQKKMLKHQASVEKQETTEKGSRDVTESNLCSINIKYVILNVKDIIDTGRSGTTNVPEFT